MLHLSIPGIFSSPAGIMWEVEPSVEVLKILEPGNFPAFGKVLP